MSMHHHHTLVSCFVLSVFFSHRSIDRSTQVLSHYDEVKKDGAKLTLGKGGTARDDGAAAAGAEGEEKTKVLESLKVEVKDASEYYTTEEMAKFKKPKKVRCDQQQWVHILYQFARCERLACFSVSCRNNLKCIYVHHVFTIRKVCTSKYMCSAFRVE